MWDYPSETRLATTGFPNLYCKGAGNVDNPDSPTRQGYGDRGRALHELRARRQVLEGDGERWSPPPEPIQRGRRRHDRSCALHRPGPGALQARAAGQGALVLRSWPRRLVAASLADRAA